MTKLNKIWAILSKGDVITAQDYARRVDADIYNTSSPVEDVIDMLVPYSDTLLRSHYIEQLTQLVLMSSVRERALNFDPLNTYEKAKLVNPTPGETTDLEDPTVVFLTQEGAHETQGQGILDVTCTVDPVSSTFTTIYDSSTFTVTNNLTSPLIILDGFVIRLSGDLPASTFSFNVRYVADPNVDWERITEITLRRSYTWTDPSLKEIWDTSPVWVDRLGALILSTVEQSSNE